MADPSACRTGIPAQQGMLSISETKRNHMGQGLGNTGFFENAVTIAEV